MQTQSVKDWLPDAAVEPGGQLKQRPQAVPHDLPSSHHAQLVTSLPFSSVNRSKVPSGHDARAGLMHIRSRRPLVNVVVLVEHEECMRVTGLPPNSTRVLSNPYDLA